MTREHKAGLAVSCSFLCLVGSVVCLKLREPPPGAAAPNSSADAGTKHSPGTAPQEKDGKRVSEPPPLMVGNSTSGGTSSPLFGQSSRTTDLHPAEASGYGADLASNRVDNHPAAGAGQEGRQDQPRTSPASDPGNRQPNADSHPGPGTPPGVHKGDDPGEELHHGGKGKHESGGANQNATNPLENGSPPPGETAAGGLERKEQAGLLHSQSGNAANSKEEPRTGVILVGSGDNTLPTGTPSPNPQPGGRDPVLSGGNSVVPLGSKGAGVTPNPVVEGPPTPPPSAAPATVPDKSGSILPSNPLPFGTASGLPPSDGDGKPKPLTPRTGSGENSPAGLLGGGPSPSPATPRAGTSPPPAVHPASEPPKAPETGPITVGIPPAPPLPGGGQTAPGIPPGDPLPPLGSSSPPMGTRADEPKRGVVPPPGGAAPATPPAAASSQGGSVPEPSLFIPDLGPANSATSPGAAPSPGAKGGSDTPAAAGATPGLLGTAYTEGGRATASPGHSALPQSMPGMIITDPQSAASGAGSGAALPPGTQPTAPMPAPARLSPMAVAVPNPSAPTTPAPGVLSPSPIPAGLPPQAGSVQPASNVESWDETMYTCKAGDTFQTISARFYGGRTDYAQALQQYNKKHPQASDAMQQTGTLTEGEKVFIPPLAILEKKHGSHVPKTAGSALPG
jgi:hypothetical protein